MARDDVQSLNVGCVDSFVYVSFVDDAFVERVFHLLDVYAQSAGSVGLRISIYYKYIFFLCSQ